MHNFILEIKVFFVSILLLGSLNIANGSQKISGEEIKNNAINNKHIKKNSIDGNKIAFRSLSGRKLENDTIEGKKIQKRAIETKHLEDQSVNTKKIKDKSVTSEKIAPDSIGTSKLKNNSITYHKLKTKNVPTNTNLLSWNQSEDILEWISINDISSGSGANSLFSFDDQVISSEGSIHPGSDNVYNLGSALFRWKNIYIQSVLDFNNQLNMKSNDTTVLSLDNVGNMNLVGDLTATKFIGDGSQLSNISLTSESLDSSVRSGVVVDQNGNGADYVSIQSAIDSLPTEGGRIFVKASNMSYELVSTLQINKDNIELIGIGHCIIEGSFSTALIDVSGNYCALRNLHFLNNGTNSTLSINGNSTLIENCQFSSSTGGKSHVDINSDNNLIKNNTIGATNTGVKAIQIVGVNNLITGNNIDTEIGINIASTSYKYQIMNNHVEITQGQSSNHKCLVFTATSSDMEGIISGNNFYQTGTNGITINQSSISILNNIFNNLEYISVSSANYVKFDNNQLISTRLHQNIGSYNQFTGNIVRTSATQAFALYNSSYCNISNNHFLRPSVIGSADGLYLNGSINNIINANFVENFSTAISIAGNSDKNVITSNWVTTDIHLWVTNDQNIVFGNAAATYTNSGSSNQPWASNGGTINSVGEFNLDY